MQKLSIRKLNENSKKKMLFPYCTEPRFKTTIRGTSEVVYWYLVLNGFTNLINDERLKEISFHNSLQQVFTTRAFTNVLVLSVSAVCEHFFLTNIKKTAEVDPRTWSGTYLGTYPFVPSSNSEICIRCFCDLTPELVALHLQQHVNDFRKYRRPKRRQVLSRDA